MAKSQIAGIKRTARKLDSAINKELKRAEARKAKEAVQREVEAKRKKLAALRKK